MFLDTHNISHGAELGEVEAGVEYAGCQGSTLFVKARDVQWARQYAVGLDELLVRGKAVGGGGSGAGHPRQAGACGASRAQVMASGAAVQKKVRLGGRKRKGV